MTQSLYNQSTISIKQRLYRYQVENGVNLLEEIFKELTKGQSQQLGVIGDRLRMDTQTKHKWLTMLGELLARLTHIYTVEHSPRYTLIERLILGLKNINLVDTVFLSITVGVISRINASTPPIADDRSIICHENYSIVDAMSKQRSSNCVTTHAGKI